MSDYEAAARRGLNAQREWTEVEAAFERVREASVTALINSSPTDEKRILRLQMAVQNLDAVRKALLDVVNNGTVAQHAIAAQGLTSPH